MVDRILEQIPWSLGGKNEGFLDFFLVKHSQDVVVERSCSGQVQCPHGLARSRTQPSLVPWMCCLPMGHTLTASLWHQWGYSDEKNSIYAEYFCILKATALQLGSLNRKTHVHSKHSVWFDNADSFQLNVGASRVLQEACPAPGFQQRYHFHTFSKQLTQVFLQMQHSWCRNVFCGWVAALWAKTSWEENNTMKKKFWFSLCCDIFVSFVDFFFVVDLFLSFK